MLRFDPVTGLFVDATEVVREVIRADWVAAFATPLAVENGSPLLDTAPATPAGQLIDSQTAMVTTKDSEVLYMAQQFNPQTAEGVWQDALGQIYFLTRKTAEPTLVECLCTGLAGTVIAVGARVKFDVDGMQLYCVGGGTIPAGGKITLDFAALTSGPLPVPAHTINKIVTVTPGWDTVDNPTAGSLGRDAETRAEFEQRRSASVAKNAHGTVAAIYGALADLANVLDIVVLENTGNDPIVKAGVTITGHSIYASIYGGDDAAIAAVLYSKKDAGCGTAGNTTVSHTATDILGQPIYIYKIERPDPLPFGVQVNIRLTPTTPASIVQDVQNSIVANFGGADGSIRVKIASTVYASRFYAPAVQAGVQDLVSVKITAPTGGTWLDEITVRADQMPVISAVDVVVNIISGG
ncbi:MAG: baseplate J/gp47 family protein [Desulfovibrionaceae bacterium]